MDSPRRIVIVGAGQCGIAAAKSLRDEGYDGDVSLIGAEPHLPYERPPLTKEYLRGEADEGALNILPASWYPQNAVELRLATRVTAIDPHRHTASLSDGDSVAWDRLLLATGGQARRLPGDLTNRVIYLRGLDEARCLREQLRRADRVVVVGGGFLGCEVAASASVMGLRVTMLEALQMPLGRALGPDVASVIAEMHRQHGVHLRTGEAVDRVESRGAELRVTTKQATVLECDVVVAGLGIVPDTGLCVDGMEIANFTLPRLGRGSCQSVGIGLPPYLAKPHLLLKQSLSKSFDWVSHGASP